MTPGRRRLTVALSAFVAVASGAAAAATAAARPAKETPSATLGTAVLSARRAPALLSDLVAQTRLASRVRTFLRAAPATSCLVLRAGDSTLMSMNEDELLVPASALKLTTAAAFLARVGGTGRFTTEVRGPKPDRDGVVSGDLVMVGGGDPLLATEGYVQTRRREPRPATEFTSLVTALRDAGVRRVTGGLGVNDTIYDDERRVPTWSPGYTAAGDVGPIGALAVDDGFTSYSPLMAAPDPAVAAGQRLRDALGAAGVTVGGAVFRTAARPATTLARVASAPFDDVVEEMLRESDNNTAELLLKELARRQTNTVGTRASGVTARARALAEMGLDADGIAAVDGSGLDRANRATCGVLVGTLTTRPGGYALEDMLAVAGRTGTLDDRFTSSPLAGRLRAKTGSLRGVTALVGVADPTAAVKLRFAFIANGAIGDDAGKALQDRLVATLATFPEAPRPADLAP